MRSGINDHVKDGMSMPINWRRPLANPDAAMLGTKLCSSMMRKMRSRVAGSTSGLLFKTRETVVLDTPANRAISSMVGLPGILALFIRLQTCGKISGTDCGTDCGTGYEQVY